MIPLRRIWFNYLAEYHNERALDHARRRDRALRKLEQMERDHQRRENQRLIAEILERQGRRQTAPTPAPQRPEPRLVSLRTDVH